MTDMINPNHYRGDRQYEPIAVIEDWGLNYRLGNAVKYISRNGRKPGEDPPRGPEEGYLVPGARDRRSGQAQPICPVRGSVRRRPGLLRSIHRPGRSRGPRTSDDATIFRQRLCLPRLDGPSLWGLSRSPTRRSPSLWPGKALDQFDDDEIVSTVERRGMVIGFKKDGTSCVLKNGRCE